MFPRGWKCSCYRLARAPERKESEIAQSCPTLCDPMDCSLLGSSIHRIFQTRVLEWIAISFSRGSSRPRDQTRVSHIAGRHFTIWATWEAQRAPGAGEKWSPNPFSLEKTLMLGKVEGKRRKWWQRMRWLDGIISSVDMNLNKFQEIVEDRGAWPAAVHGSHKEWDMT